MHKKLLMVLAVLCQFLVLFPFLVMSEGIGFGEFVWWHYAAMYAAAAGFWAVGGCCAAGLPAPDSPSADAAGRVSCQGSDLSRRARRSA